MVLAEQIRKAFAETSQRHTRPRRLIAENLIELATTGVDFTIDDLWQTLRLIEPQMGRATVYRSIEMLVHAGLINRIEFDDGIHHYRLCGGTHHHHLICTQCRQIVEIDLCLPEQQLLALSQQTGFTIENHVLTVFGLCPQCQAGLPSGEQ